MSTDLVTIPAEPVNLPAEVVDEVIKGDLKKLTPVQRNQYYLGLCKKLGLDPLLKPFAYLEMKGENGEKKLTLYATKSCTDQLRHRDQVSVKIVEEGAKDGVYRAKAVATTPSGRCDEDVGTSPYPPDPDLPEDIRPETKARLMNEALERRSKAPMMAVTKAKRRVTLAICGAYFIDESEIDSIPGARRVKAEEVEVVSVTSSKDSPTQEEIGLLLNLANQANVNGHSVAKRAGVSYHDLVSGNISRSVYNRLESEYKALVG